MQKPPKQHYLSMFQRHSIITLIGAGFSLDSIAAMICCSKRAVCRWLHRAIEDFNLEDKQRSGRPMLLSEAQQKAVVEYANAQPFVTPAIIKNELKLNCSYRTIDRVLIDSGLYGRVALKSYPYTDTQKQIRLQFCNYILDNVKKDPNFLSKIFFTDESSLQMGLHGNRVYVRRPIGDTFTILPDYIAQDMSKKQSGKVKFFAGFCLNGVGKLYFYEKSMTGDKMIDIIKENVIPETTRLFGENFQWMILHDNDKKWRNYKVRDYTFNQCIIQVNDSIWPAYSPDLNPIENLWAELSRKVFAKHPSTVQLLKQYTIEEWAKIPQTLIADLVNSMVKRAELCIAAGGAKIHY